MLEFIKNHKKALIIGAIVFVALIVMYFMFKKKGSADAAQKVAENVDEFGERNFDRQCTKKYDYDTFATKVASMEAKIKADAKWMQNIRADPNGLKLAIPDENKRVTYSAAWWIGTNGGKNDGGDCVNDMSDEAVFKKLGLPFNA